MPTIVSMLIRPPTGDPYEIGVSGTQFVAPDDATSELPSTESLWALPGLADCHAHVTMNSLHDFDSITDATMAATIPTATWAHLTHGVLLILDKGGKSDATVLTLDHDADLRPYAETAGAMIAPKGGYYGGFGTEVEPEDLVAYLQTKATTGGGWVKLVGDWPRRGQGPVNNWSFDILSEAVSTVHAAGARVAIHSMAHSASEAVAAGVDSIEHGPFLTGEDLGQLAQRGGAWVPTIVNMLFLIDLLGADSSGGRMFAEGLNRMRDLLPLAEALSVTVLAGTDMAVPHGEVAIEAERLVEYGLSTAAAVSAVSTSAYDYIGRPVAATPGHEADAVFFESNPIDDISALREPALILRRGKIVGGSHA